MRWFFALNENSPGFWDYANLVQVAVSTARRHTALEPVCIYDGGESALTAWLRAAGVRIFFRRTFVAEIAPGLSAIARGAYLRLEIPALCQEQGWTDEFALYTDCDVMFRAGAEPALAALRPKYFAVAPESDRADFTDFNSGVMLLNVPALAAELPALTGTIRANLAVCLAPPYDQRALQLHFAGRAEPLPLPLNWKPWWGDDPAAAIVHFHGPKPAQKYLLLNHRAPAELLARATPDFFIWCRHWDDELLAALAAHPWPESAPRAQVAPGFGGFPEENATGLGASEGPFPELMLPVVRWGFAPQTEILFSLAPGESCRLEADFHCPYADQVLTLAFDGRELARVRVERVSDPQPLVLELPAAPGPHRLALAYARNFASPGDPRPLALLFRALRIVRA